MCDSYFFLMNDKDRNPFLPGILDIAPGRILPVVPSKLSFPPVDLKEIENESVFLNFNENVDLDFDYREDQGHIISEYFMSKLSPFNSPPKIVKPLSIWMGGVEQPIKLNYMAFYRGKWDRGNQLDDDFSFYDRGKSVYVEGRRKDMVPIGEIVLTDKAKQYDYFQLLDTTYLRTFIVINDKVKNALEMSALKGFKIIPLQNGFSEYCKAYGRTIEELLPKIKRRMP